VSHGLDRGAVFEGTGGRANKEWTFKKKRTTLMNAVGFIWTFFSVGYERINAIGFFSAIKVDRWNFGEGYVFDQKGYQNV
jgi:hypothetical protein